MKFWLNGKIVNRKHVQFSPFDHGLLYGHGCFETFRSYCGKIPFLDYHYARLIQSLNVLGIVFPYSSAVVEKAATRLIAAMNGRDCVFRITVTAGEWQEGGYTKPNVWMTAVILGNTVRGVEKRGKWLAIPYAGRAAGVDVRGLHYSDLRRGQLDVADAMKYEGLFVDAFGIVAEGVRSNIFWVKDGILYTPSLSLGIVKGITREWVMTLAQELGIEVREGEFDRSELESAHECFLTNAVDELIPLSQIGRRKFAGNEGPVYSRLHQAYVYIIEQRLKGD